MRNLLYYVVPYADEPDSSDSDSEYVKIKVRRTPNKLRKPNKFSLRRPKPSWSTNDLSSMYSTSSPPASGSEPRQEVDNRMSFERREGRPSLSISAMEYYRSSEAPALSLREKCLRFLEDKVFEQEEKRKLAIPQARAVYGEPDAVAVVPDISKEVHNDFSVCAMSDEEAAAWRAQRAKWNTEKARGIHYPSVLNVRRKELTAALQAAHKANIRICPKPPRPMRTLPREKCKNCDISQTVIPPGLNPEDWLPLVNLRRAQRCERQRAIPQEAEKARTIVINRVIQENLPRLSVRTDRRKMRSRPGPSPLSRSVSLSAVPISTASASIDEAQSSDPSDIDSRADEQTVTEDIDGSSNSFSECSDGQTDLTSEHSEPDTAVYQAVEVRELRWSKKYRVPKFLPASKEKLRLFVADTAPANAITVAEPASSSPLTKWNCDKPLPPLPAPSPPHSPPPCSPTYPRGLRRSQSIHLGVLGRQRSVKTRTQVCPLQ